MKLIFIITIEISLKLLMQWDNYKQPLNYNELTFSQNFTLVNNLTSSNRQFFRGNSFFVKLCL